MTYEELVNFRKAYKVQHSGLINQSELDFDIECYLDPWGKWHNHLNPDILVLGQDWGGQEYYIKNKGKDTELNPTCKNLSKLFNSIGIDIGTPSDHSNDLKIHLANIIPFIRKGKMQGSLDSILNQAEINTFAALFITPLIEITQPKIILTLGSASTKAVLNIFNVKIKKKKLTDILSLSPIDLTANIKLLPMFHCGASVINRNRDFEKQKEDWSKLKALLLLN